MKKILLSILYFFVCICCIQAQILYGTTTYGGTGGGGTINKFVPATNNLTVVKAFESIAMNPLYTSFIQAKNGKLYGMTAVGGSNSNGVIFSFDPNSSSYAIVYNFDGNNGTSPSGSLVQAGDGKLYGMTFRGGSSNYGVIFSFDPSTSIFTKLKDLDGTNAAFPYGSLMEAINGKLYGMTSKGGSSQYGVIFSFDPSTSTFKKLKDFDFTNGAYPEGTLMQANDGKLYGTTGRGGTSDAGVIFSFDPSSSSFTKLKDFDYTNGTNSYGSLMQASDGKLYGLSKGDLSGNHGAIFSFDLSSSSYIKLKEFDVANGENPYGRLIQASDGRLYGLTYSGGSSNAGVIFSFDPSASIYTKLKDLDVTIGAQPYGSLMQATDGKLYGLTYGGGSSNAGVIFSFDLSSSSYNLLKELSINKEGSYISSGLLQAGDGKLYGTTCNGGSSGNGVIFSLDPSTFNFSKLKDFDGNYGAHPSGNLIEGSDGKFYGICGRNQEIVFSFDPSTSIYTELKNFIDADGSVVSLMLAKNGKLYGMTKTKDGVNPGVIFSFEVITSTYTELAQFIFDESIPIGSLVEANNGKLYGLLQASGSVELYAKIFSFDPSTLIIERLLNIVEPNGFILAGSLIQANDGKLYGTTYSGGHNKVGFIFSFNPATSSYEKLKDFAISDGAYPPGSLIQAGDGKLYGMTSKGGKNNLGVIFSFDPSSSTYTNLKDYMGVNGANPGVGSAFIEVTDDDENKLPTVLVTSPVNNAKYVGPAMISLIADVGDPDGTIKKVEFYNGATLLRTEYFSPYSWNWKDVPIGNYTITAKAYDNKDSTARSVPIHISVVPNNPPTADIITPVNEQVVAGPATIKLKVDAKDIDGSIIKVELYNDAILLRSEYFTPYSWNWKNVPLGSYTFTAKAYDDKGGITTSAPVQITVALNKPPTVKISTPVNGQVIPGPAGIILQADARDPDGSIAKVELYAEQILLRTEYYAPYSFNWKNVQAGKSTITARATDNLGKVTTSAPVTITVTSQANPIAGQSFVSNENQISNGASVKLLPNPAKDVLNIHTSGFEQNKKLTISVVSVSGVIVKSIYTTPGTKKQMNVSSLRPGVYVLKVTGGENVFYIRFVKL